MTNQIKFTKMQGSGNDYVYIDATAHEVLQPERLAVEMSDRHFGIGSDGLVLILPSDKADFRMRMFNADGSEAQMCGNASRCVGKYVYEHGLTTQKTLLLETASGIKRLDLHVSGGKVSRVSVDMGVPVLEPAAIPVNLPGERLVGVPLALAGKEYRMTCVSMGNPHAVLFVPSLEAVDVHRLGPLVERHAVFPERCNIEFAEIVSSMEIRMRVWERGAGETLACGTGACATLVAAVLNGLAQRQAKLRLLGGDLDIAWREDGHVCMTGGAETVFDGVWLR